MPPKKKVAADGAEVEGGPFKWEGPNDNKLLLLIQGRYVKPDEYEQLSQAFPSTTMGSIRNRISALRVKQRDLYAGLSWELPDGASGYSNKKGANSNPNTPKKTPKKRAADDSGESAEGGGSPVKEKKARQKKAKKEDVKKSKSEVEVEDVVHGDEAAGVKDEVGDEEI